MNKSPKEMRDAIELMGRDSAIVHAVNELAHRNGWSEGDRYAAIAYYALQGLCETQAALFDRLAHASVRSGPELLARTYIDPMREELASDKGDDLRTGLPASVVLGAGS